MLKWFRYWRRSSRKGHAVVETALIAPWVFFLFVGVLDFGFYAYSLISVQNAARVAALRAGGGGFTQAGACDLVLQELRWMPNTRNLTACSGALKVDINPANYTDAQGNPARWVQVTYETIPLIPIPGLVTGKATISRRVETRIFGD